MRHPGRTAQQERSGRPKRERFTRCPAGCCEPHVPPSEHTAQRNPGAASPKSTKDDARTSRRKPAPAAIRSAAGRLPPCGGESGCPQFPIPGPARRKEGRLSEGRIAAGTAPKPPYGNCASAGNLQVKSSGRSCGDDRTRIPYTAASPALPAKMGDRRKGCRHEPENRPRRKRRPETANGRSRISRAGTGCPKRRKLPP